MKLKLLFLLSLCIAVFATNLYGGVEPSPFVSEINQLGAVVNGLNSCLDRVQKAIAYPPNPVLPSPNLNGAVNRLAAIDGQVGSLDDFIYNTINSVMGFEPTPFRTDLIPALEAVRNVSEDIVGAINAYPPNPIYPELDTALGNVKTSAINLTDTVEWGIEQLSGGGGECLIFEDYTFEDCIDNVGCTWITDPGVAPHCCCITIGY